MSSRQMIRAEDNAKKQSLTAVWQGPLPPPHEFRQYEEILPGATDRILKLAENEQNFQHEHAMSIVKHLSADKNLSHCDFKRGQRFALIVSLSSFASALFCVWMKSPIVAGIFVGTTLISLVQSFCGKHDQDSDGKNK